MKLQFASLSTSAKNLFQFIIEQRQHEKLHSFEEFVLQMAIEGFIDFDIHGEHIEMISLQKSYLNEDFAIGLLVELDENYCSIRSYGNLINENKSK